MQRQEFESLCCDLNAGGTLYVEHLDSRYSGKVLACSGDNLEVEAFGNRFRWLRDRCRQASGATPLGPPSNR